jgi:hypothetical protein
MSAVGAAIRRQTIKKLVDYFRNTGALTPESAVEVDYEVVNSEGGMKVENNSIYGYRYFKRVPGTSKFYLVEGAYSTAQKLGKRITITFLIALAIVLLAIFIAITNLLS